MNDGFSQGIDNVIQDIDPKKARESLKRSNPLNELLPAQRKFLKYFIKTRNRVDAWMQSHPTCKSKEHAYIAVGTFLKNHPDVVDWLYDLAGLGEDDFMAVVRDSMQANKSQFYLGKKYEDPDHYARLKAVELGMKMKGHDEGKKVGNQVLIQIISDKDKGIFKIQDGE